MKKMLLLVVVAGLLSFPVQAQGWKSYEDSAARFYKKKLPDSAIKYYDEAIRLYSADHAIPDSNYSRLMTNLSVAYRNLNQFDKAEQVLKTLLYRIEQKNGKNNLSYADVINSLISLSYVTGKLDQAEVLLLECADILTKVPGDNRYRLAIICNSLAVFYRSAGTYDKAEQYYLKTLTLLEQVGGQEIGYAITINNLGVLYNFTGQYKEAEKCMLKAKEMKAALFGTTHEEYAITCSTLGMLYKGNGKYDEAKSLFVEARKIIENKFSKNHYDYASFTYNLASVYNLKGEYDQAEALYSEAKEIQERIYQPNHPEIARTYFDLSQMYFDLGQEEKGIDYLEKSKKMTASSLGKNHPEYVLACQRLAYMKLMTNDYEKAISLANEANELINTSPVVSPLVQIENNTLLYVIHLYKEDYDVAEPIGLRVLDSVQKYSSGQSPNYISICHNLGWLYCFRDNPLKAESFFKKSFDGSILANGPSSLVSIRQGLALGVVASLKKEYDRADSIYKQIWVLLQKQQEQQFRFQNEAEKKSFLEVLEETKGKICSFYLDYGILNKDKNEQLLNVILQHKLVLSDDLKELKETINVQNDPVLQKKFSDWIYLKEQIAFWHTRPVESRKGIDQELEQKADDLEKELTRFSAGFRQQQQKPQRNWQSIRQSLKAQEAAIEFADFRYFDGKRWTDSVYYIAILMRQDLAEPVVIKLFEKKQLDSVMRVTRQINELQTANFRYAKSNLLYQLIGQPLEKYCNGISRIYFAPSGLLHQLSIPAVPVNSKERLGDKYRWTQLSTVASGIDQQPDQIKPDHDILLYGGILYDGDSLALRQATARYQMKDIASRSLPEDSSRGNIWAYLPNSKNEVEAIQKLARPKQFKTSVFTGWDASEESVKAIRSENAPQVIHFATHGFFFPDPRTKRIASVTKEGRTIRQTDNPLLRSGLTMAGANFAWDNKPVAGIQDGILTAYELSNLYFPRTKLAVLSACRTGLGDIQGSEGVYGLQRAFKIAGVKNLVMSLWDVPDNETAEFMIDFYRNMFGGQPIEDAFYNTQTNMKKKYRDEPYKWAAWILVR